MPEGIKTMDEQVSELLALVKDGKQLMEAISDELDKKYLIDGKTMTEWREYFNVKLPEGITPVVLSEANAKLNNAISEAGFYFAHASLVEQCIKTGAENKFDDAFRLLVSSYTAKGTKLPASTTLEKMAEGNDLSIKSALATATTRARFWKSIAETLHEQRRVLEEQRWILFTEMKAAQG